MKKITRFLVAISLTLIIMLQSSCIGSFELTKNLYHWNTTEVGGKWGQELVFAAFIIIPVYSVALIADGLVLNTIEFWSGENPLAMKDGEKDSRIVQQGDNAYLLTVEKNIIHVEKLAGENQGEQGDFIFNPENASWTFTSGEKVFNLE